MSLTITTEVMPIETDADGVIRVGKTKELHLIPSLPPFKKAQPPKKSSNSIRLLSWPTCTRLSAITCGDKLK